MHRGFEIEDGNGGVFGKGVQYWVSPLSFPILEFSKRANTDRRNVTPQYANKLRQMLCLVPIHYNTIAMFQRPRSAAGLKYHGIATKLINANLHGCTRAQAWIKENQCNGLAIKRTILYFAALDLDSRIDQPNKMRDREIRCFEKMVHANNLLSLKGINVIASGETRRAFRNCYLVPERDRFSLANDIRPFQGRR